ncbi:MAG: hypothetical protein A2231_08560 [Candidatus Firestonebacteria bacterium RIFOXYA2_FULL_40_8]|nr:MAG: hypothetical protein A2231_08560 [Candidatus Firestonebacteria bacterium RIFOXYA2_FULL_40_8]
MKTFIQMILMVLSFFSLACADIETFVPKAVQIGDPAVSYANIEFTADGRYMVWFEMVEKGKAGGTVWHCAIDPKTGELSPRDGKGFRAYESSFMGRANPGMDAKGSYYVGLDNKGSLILVRPASGISGQVSVLPTPPDITRRAIYPTNLPAQSSGFVYWIKNEKQPGGGMSRQNNWFELQTISLEDPERIHTVARQDRPKKGFAPMDIGFVRWIGGKTLLTYGVFDEDKRVQIMAYDANNPKSGSKPLTDDPHSKIDPFGWTYNGSEILLAGIDGKAVGQVYIRKSGESRFNQTETIVPTNSGLEKPGLAQSFEPFEFGGKAYAVYQINNRPQQAFFWNITFSQPGEIWMTTLFQEHQQQWRLTPGSDTPVAEPEPVVGDGKAWVFYNATPKEGFMAGVWKLYRAETPLDSKGSSTRMLNTK